MASSSTSSVPKSFKYDVFLSFSGEDTRKNFVDHLHHALERENHIDTYKDDKNMKKGERISTELIKAIEASRFHIIIFSKSYASSSWCLNELVKIMECQKTTEQKAYPVFYDVEPTEVRKQSGAVGKAFAQRRMDEDAGKWRKALKEAADLAGFPLKTTANGHEAQFIETIVEVISKELDYIDISVDEPLVGMETRRDAIVSILETSFDDVRMIGIWGIGGGGKTTLARAVFDQISSQFEGKSFVENVREISKSTLSGLKLLQEKILENVLGKRITVNDVHEGKKMMKRKIHGRKVLVVLDDVDHIDQLVALAGEPNWFGPGSRIIITTRDKEVLTTHEVNSIHDVNLLSNEEAINLFNRFAFKKGEIPNSRFKELSQQVVRHAGGLPLTIKVLGRDLKGKDEVEYWNDYLKRLKTIPPEETLKQLELSYVSLKDDYKSIFLDVACFWRGEQKDQAIRALQSCNLHPIVGLGVLERKSLITVSEYGWLEMHDSIQDMGWDIVRREHRDEPHKHSRLWIDEEIEKILADDLGTEATRCISMTAKFNQNIIMKGLRKMKNLRSFHLFSLTDDYAKTDGDREVDEVSQYFPDALQYLCWDWYPFRCLPNTFRAKHLVGLEMPFYRGRQLWESGEKEVLNKLKYLVLYHSMLRTLDLGVTPNLETLSLIECYHFEELHIPHKHPKLKSLHLTCSEYLKSFDLRQTPNLEILNLQECHDLEEFHMPDECPTLKSLNLRCSKFKILYLRRTLNLEMLVLEGCDDLVKLHMPDGLPELKSLCLKVWTLDLGPTLNPEPSSLEMLSLSGCHDLLHISIGCPKLKSLHLTRSKLKSFDLRQTPNLEILSLKDCDDLEELHMPDEFAKLEYLILDCSKLRTLDLEGTPNLKALTLNHCDDLVDILMPAACPKLESLVLSDSKMKTLDLRLTTNLETLNLKNCHDLVELSMPVECPKLKTLHLSCSKLRTLNLGLTPNLEELILRKCDGMVKLCMPVECPKLKTLILTHSKLRILNLRRTPDLEILELQTCFDLVKLRMSRCLMLKQLKLRSLSKLRKFDIWLTPNVKYLNISDCCNLVELHAPTGCLEKMGHIDFPGCSRLNIFKSPGGDSVAELRLIVEPVEVCPLHPNNNLPKFRYRCYPSSVGKLKKLISVGLCACTNLKKFSRSIRNICDLQCLRKLTLKGSIPEVPEDLHRLENLEKLSFVDTEIIHLPDSICMLKHLKSLKLKCCLLLEKLPEDLGRLECLEELILVHCERLRDIPKSIGKMKYLQYLHLSYCMRVKKLPEEVGHLVSLEDLRIEGTRISHLPYTILLLNGVCIFGSHRLLLSSGFTCGTKYREDIVVCWTEQRIHENKFVTGSTSADF